MAILEDATGRSHGVRARHLVGRSRRMDTTLARPEVSSEHAVIVWSGSVWTVRDLASRNGTLVRGERIAPGLDVPLAAGDTIAFGHPEITLVLRDVGAPGPFAAAGDAEVLGEGDLLALPSLDDPQVLVTRGEEGRWVRETEHGEASSVEDGDEVDVDGARWTLCLPEVAAATLEVSAGRVDLGDVGLDLRVSADEEYVEVDVRLPAGPVTLPSRTHHYLLVVLARARLGEAADVAEAERGWVYVSDLERMLRYAKNRINLGIHRARREIEALGVDDAQGLVERRPTTKQLRLGVADVTVGGL